MSSVASPEAAFLAALPAETRVGFDDAAALAATLATLYESARTAYRELAVDPTTYARELARRLGDTATLERVARVRADHVYLAIACMAGDERAIRIVEAEFLDQVDTTARRLRARHEQAAEVRGDLRRILFTTEPGRSAALSDYSGRGDLGTYVRVIATRALVRAMTKDRREVVIDEQSFLDKLSPVSSPELSYLRETYRAEVNAAIRAALASLSDDARALLRYSVIDGWSVDRIGDLYGVHRATAARRVAAAREELGRAIRGELAARLEISADEVDSVVRLVQSRVDLSLERLLG